MEEFAGRLTRVAQSRLRRRNTRVLARYGALVLAIVVVDALLFQIVMRVTEGRSYSLLVGLYWTVSTMTTLGLGDLVFTSWVGRVLTMVVLLTGLVLVFVVFPFAFIRYFYAPWLESRPVSDRLSGHVIIASYDNIAPALIGRLESRRIPYIVLEPDRIRASQLHDDGIAVFTGEVDDRSTYEQLRVGAARLVLANMEDTVNTNITLTVRELAPAVPIVAMVESEASIDILEFAGANHILAPKQHLGEQLAHRVNAGHAQTHVIGSFRGLQIGEFTVANTPFQGKRLAETSLRRDLGVNVIGVLEHAALTPAHPDMLLGEHSVPVVIGTQEQMASLDEFLTVYNSNTSPVLVIGGGKVGQAAARRLKRRGVPVHILEKDQRLQPAIADLPDRLIIGDAAERAVLMEAGLAEAPAVLITSNDDAMNVYLTLYCRRLAPGVRVLSRINHERNIEAVRRAGADLALSHFTIGVESVLAVLSGGEMIMLGAQLELREMSLPASLAGKRLAESEIATHTGLNVVAIRTTDGTVIPADTEVTMSSGSALVLIGEAAQFDEWKRRFG